MKVRRLLFSVALIATVSSGVVVGNSAAAQDAVPNPGQNVAQDAVQHAGQPADAGRVSLFGGAQEVEHPSESYVGRTRMTPQELRTARAIYRANQRTARMEYNLWLGHEPLRPRWNAVPMMSSRYTNPRFYVPVYIYNR